MKLERKIVKGFTLILWGGILLYGVGGLIVLLSNLELRYFVKLMGNCFIFAGIPLWAVVILWYGLKKANVRRIVRTPIVSVMLVGIVIWGFIVTIMYLFFADQEKQLVGKYLVVDTCNEWMEAPEWSTYETAAIFFRRPVAYSTEMEQFYLEKKYGEHFTYSVEPSAMKDYVGLVKLGATWKSQEHEQLMPASVYMIDGTFLDNYLDILASWYFCNVYEEQGLQTAYTWYDGMGVEEFCLVLEEENMNLFCKEVQFLLKAAGKEKIFKKNEGELKICTMLNGKMYYADLPFDKQWKKASFQEIYELVQEGYQKMQWSADWDAQHMR